MRVRVSFGSTLDGISTLDLLSVADIVEKLLFPVLFVKKPVFLIKSPLPPSIFEVLGGTPPIGLSDYVSSKKPD